MVVPIYCNECGRPNSASALRCIYCAVPISGEGSPRLFEAISLELEYLSGIERLEDPMPVRLIVTNEGVEVRELMPGTRTAKIAANSLIEAQAVDASTTENEIVNRSWWQIITTPLSALRHHPVRVTNRTDYFLTIRYRVADEIRSAVFHREDRAAPSLVETAARCISLLIERKEA